jgi:hypothetical protein
MLDSLKVMGLGIIFVGTVIVIVSLTSDKKPTRYIASIEEANANHETYKETCVVLNQYESKLLAMTKIPSHLKDQNSFELLKVFQPYDINNKECRMSFQGRFTAKNAYNATVTQTFTIRLKSTNSGQSDVRVLIK